MAQITVMSGPERRRRWSEADRAAMLEEAFAPGACVAAVARRHDVSTGLLYGWRRQTQLEVAEPAFVEAVVTAEPAAPASSPTIMVELSSGTRISIAAAASPALVAAVLRALR